MFSDRVLYADLEYVIIFVCWILKFWDMGVWSGDGGWIWVFLGGFVRWGCEGIFMVYIWVESSVFALFDGGLIFG